MSIFNYFQHLALTTDQEMALKKLETFISGTDHLFMLKGYAGSGKTTLLKGLVKYLNAIEKDFVLMAPTGRAAKTIREKTGFDAYTIHKSIYSYDNMVEFEEGNSFYYYYKIRNNIDVVGKIFIVDEASMLSDTKIESEFFRFGSGRLLSDLIDYTRVAHHNANSKIIFIGDPCQLPPVGDNSSKAFDGNYLKEKFNLISDEAELKEVKRQDGESGILQAAATIRKSISSGFFNDFNLRSNAKDILNPNYETFLNTWENTTSSKIIIASKNKTCLDLNLQIRERIFGKKKLPIQKSDIVIMGANNYTKGVFNGEFAVVNEVSDLVVQRTIGLKGKGSVTLYWREVELVFADKNENGNNKKVKGMILENSLYGDNNLRPEEMQALYVDFITRHKYLKPKTQEFQEAILKDEYFNCLLLKYGYAITCHKAQGGEWDNVFTVWDHDNAKNFNYFSDCQSKTGKNNKDFYRWAYTAITRASKKLLCINPPFFTSFSGMSFIDVNVQKALNQLEGHSNLKTEININEVLPELKKFGLADEPLSIQDHFIHRWHYLQKQDIKIEGWQKVGYEIRYFFKKDGQTAAFKYWINGQNNFKSNFQKLPAHTSSDNLFDTITKILECASPLIVNRNNNNELHKQFKFEEAIEEKWPFLKNLFDCISKALSQDEIIANIQHLEYRERYTIEKNGRFCVIDFEYDKAGFFGRVLPLEMKCNSPELLAQIKSIVNNLQKADYVI